MRPIAVACSLALLAVLVTPGCAAETEDEEVAGDLDSAYTVSAMPAEVNRRVATCFVRDWSGAPFSIRNDPSYSTTAYDSVIGPVAVKVLDGISWVFLRGGEGDAVLKKLEADLQQTASEQRLKDHQKAQLVGCVSSQLITYAFNAMSKFLGPNAAAGNYEGVCTEYARIYVRLLSALDVDAGVQSGTLTDAEGSGGHVWNWVKINGKELWVEPQTNPLRVTGPYFIDPENKSPNATPESLKCIDVGRPCTDKSQCCSGAAIGEGTAMKCAPTPCEKSRSRFCAPTMTACSEIGATPVPQVSCGASKDGANCCAFGQ